MTAIRALMGAALLVALPVMARVSACSEAPSAVGLSSGLRSERRAQADSITGRVSDTAGNPLVRVEVTLSELGRATLTDADGRFTFDDVSPGQRTLVFQRPGYAGVARIVSVPLSEPIDVTLPESPFRLPPVTVTATRSPLIAEASPLPVSALDQEQLRREPTVSLAHSLDRLAGVHTLSTGQEMGKPVVRGLTGARVLILDGGHRLEDYSWSDEDGPPIDARLADRVEVVRGPASMLYGSDAIGGVINVVPSPVPDALGRSPFTRYGLEVYGASMNGEIGTVLKAEGASGSFGWRAYGIGRRSEAIHTPAGELENTGFEAIDGSIAAGLRGDWGSAELRYARVGGDFKLLEATANPDQPTPIPDTGEEGGPVRKLADDRVQFDTNLLFGGVRLETKAQWQRHYLAEFEEGVGGGDAGQEQGLELLLNTLSLDALLHHSLSPRVRGTVGASGWYQIHDTQGIVPLLPDAKQGAVAVFALEQLDAGRARVLAGVRGDYQHLDSDPNEFNNAPSARRNFSAISGNLGTVYEVGAGFSIAANGGAAWRAPNLFELLSDGPMLGEARYVVGDPNMDPERSLNADVSLRLQRGRVHGEIAGYINWIHDYIYLLPTQAIRDSFRVYDYQQARSRLEGGELSLEVEAARALTLRGRTDYVRGTNLEADEPLPLMPPPMASLEAELHSGALSWAERAYLTAGVDMHARPQRLNPADIPTDGFTLLNFGAGLDRELGGSALRIDVRVHNALDTEYRDFLSRYKEFALNPGRNIMVRASLGL